MSSLGNMRIMSDNIQHFMNRDNMSRAELAKALGVSYSIVTQWINMKAYPRIDKIEKMANLFGIEKADLVECRNDALDTWRVDLLKRVRDINNEQAHQLIRIMDALGM